MLLLINVNSVCKNLLIYNYTKETDVNVLNHYNFC